MKKIVFLLLILMIPLSFAYSTINIYVDNSGNSVFLGEGNSNLNLPTGVKLNNGKITGNTLELTNKSGKIWDFSYFIEEGEVQVFLPEGAKVLNTNGEISLFKNQIVVYGINGINIKYSLGQSSKNNSFFFLILLIFLILAVLYFVIKKKKHKNDFDKINAIQGILNEREKLILNKLKETGKIKSSYLRRKTEIPKASFSRHIRELEKKELVKFSGEGRNKFVELK